MPDPISRASFYTDEHVADALAEGLRDAGIDVLTAHEAGMLGAADDEHLARAHAEGRVVFTRDADFLRLHADGLSHSGIAYRAQSRRASPGELIAALKLIHDVLDPADMVGHVEFL